MELGLKGKNVLITGGSKGIGLACARAFLAEGARVAIVSRSQANLDTARKALGDVQLFAADLSNAGAAAAPACNARRTTEAGSRQRLDRLAKSCKRMALGQR